VIPVFSLGKMAQYFIPIIFDYDEDNGIHILFCLMSWSYNEGAKLMEHSYLDSVFTQTLEHELSPEGKFHKKRVIWAGDHSFVEPGISTNLYDVVESINKPIPPKVKTSQYPFIVNHTKREYVNKRLIPENVDGYFIHPLPLLTAEGNDGYVGDYKGNDQEIVGYWARDVISVEKDCPGGFDRLAFQPCEKTRTY
jgi:hypothetical protein